MLNVKGVTVPTHKYNAKKHCLRVDGENMSFDSKLEADRFLALHEMEKQGKIQNLTRQPTFTLQDKFVRLGKTHRAIKYVADFMYEMGGRFVVEDAKGMKLPTYKIKLKMFLLKYHDIEFYEIERYKRGFKETQI